MASPVSPDARKELEKARTLPIARRDSPLGLARTQPIPAMSEPAQPRRVRPVAPLPEKTVAAIPATAPAKPVVEPPKPAVRLVEPAPAALKQTISVPVSAPAVRAGILPAAVDDGWTSGRKRGRDVRPLRALKLAEGTQPGVAKPTMDVPRAAGKSAVKPPAAAKPAERARLAEGSLPPPPTSGKPLPSLFSVIDRKKPEPQSAEPSRLPGLPPPPAARPSIGPKKAVSTVVAAASIGSAQMAIAATRQTRQDSVVPPPAEMMLDDDDVEELEEVEEDLPDFVPSGATVAGILMNAKSAAAPTPLFDAPRAVAMPPQATSFSAAERAFFAAGEEMDTLDMDGEQDTFDDLPGIERPGFWSRLKNRAQAGH